MDIIDPLNLGTCSRVRRLADVTNTPVKKRPRNIAPIEIQGSGRFVKAIIGKPAASAEMTVMVFLPCARVAMDSFLNGFEWD
jgi:hypothetical protein